MTGCLADLVSRKALDEFAITQVVVVAGGMDALAYRLSSEYENVTFWEVDHPSTGVVKSEGLTKLTNGDIDFSPKSKDSIRIRIPS